MTCHECKNPIEFLADMGSHGMCKRCYNAYMREYGKTRRWLNGSDNNPDLGPDIKIGLRSINGRLIISV
jgi:hypothetical protein